MTSSDRLAEMAAEIERQADPRDKLALAQHAILAEAIAEIERLKHQNMLLEADIYTLRKEQHLDHLRDRLRIMEENQAAAARETDRHISRLQARIAELESHVTITFGTLAKPTPDEPASITHGHPPSAPPHDER